MAATPAFTLARARSRSGPNSCNAVPPRHHHGIFAMMYRLPEFAIHGEQLAFMQHAHVARRVLEIGKWLALGDRRCRCRCRCNPEADRARCLP